MGGMVARVFYYNIRGFLQLIRGERLIKLREVRNGLAVKFGFFYKPPGGQEHQNGAENASENVPANLSWRLWHPGG
jgi:hypothetical protein